MNFESRLTNYNRIINVQDTFIIYDGIQKGRISRTVGEYIRIPPINPILIKRAAVPGEKSPIKSNNAGAKHVITGLCFFHYTLCLALKHPFEGERPPERIARTQVSRKELHRKNGAAKEVEIWNGGRHEV